MGGQPVKKTKKGIFDVFFEETGTWKERPQGIPAPGDTFTCIGCGCFVRRPWPSRPGDDPDIPGRPWDDDRKCFNCTFGKVPLIGEEKWVVLKVPPSELMVRMVRKGGA
jgi:hypothetical protein